MGAAQGLMGAGLDAITLIPWCNCANCRRQRTEGQVDAQIRWLHVPFKPVSLRLAVIVHAKDRGSLLEEIPNRRDADGRSCAKRSRQVWAVERLPNKLKDSGTGAHRASTPRQQRTKSPGAW